MNESAIHYELGQVIKSLKVEAQTLEEIWHARQLLWQDLGWDQSQVKLWLYCQPKVKVNGGADPRFGVAVTTSEQTPDLAEEIAQIIQSHGRPLPLVQLKNRLPAGLIVTEPMLKDAIAHHPNLQMVGPMVKLI